MFIFAGKVVLALTVIVGLTAVDVAYTAAHHNATQMEQLAMAVTDGE